MPSITLPPYAYKPINNEAFREDSGDSTQSQRALTRRLRSYEFQIRVIELAPSIDIDAPLRCDIKQERLRSSTYEAISYTWGPPIFSETLICGDSQIDITPTLDQALRRFRLKDKARVVWADAVCINQKDLKERGEQVQKMSEIYYFSRGVLIWLGNGPYMDSIMDFLWGLSSTQHEAPGSTQRANEIIEEELSRFFPSTDLQPVRDFLALPWFTRRWVVQEALLQSSATYYGGSTDITSHALDHAFFILQMSSFNFDRAVIEHMKQLEYGSDHLSELSEYKKPVAGLMGILDVMVAFEKQQCFDDRDRIYAYLGLADDIMSALTEDRESMGNVSWQNNKIRKKRRDKSLDLRRINIVVDYETSPEKVYIEFAEQMLMVKDRLELLHCAGAFRPPLHTRHTFRQFWVPDWRFPMLYTPLLNVPWFKAGGEGASADPFIHYPWCAVEGFQFDTIAVTYEIPGPKAEHKWAYRRMPPLDELCQALGMLGRYHTGERIWQALAMTLIADHALSHVLKKRFAIGKDYLYDGTRMKRDARERDMNTFLDWWTHTEAAADGGLKDATDASGKQAEVIDLGGKALQRDGLTGSFLKPQVTAGDWGLTSSKVRSGWHSRTEDEDTHTFVEHLQSMSEKTSEIKGDSQNRIVELDDSVGERFDGDKEGEESLQSQPHISRDANNSQHYQTQVADTDEGEEDDDSEKEIPKVDGEWRHKNGLLVCLQPDRQNTERYAEYVHKTLQGRVFFITKRGYMGIAPKDSIKGDSVAILHSARTPFVLQEAGGGTSGKWRLVGDAYVHGIMEGEALEMKARKDCRFLLV
jgi:hypothetical protein